MTKSGDTGDGRMRTTSDAGADGTSHGAEKGKRTSMTGRNTPIHNRTRKCAGPHHLLPPFLPIIPNATNG